MEKNRSLTEGSIWKNMLLFALPIMLGNIFQQFYNAFDAWTVGNFLDGDSLAAVSSSGSLIFMLVSFFSGLAMGAGVVIARCFGAKDYDTLSRTVHTTVAFGLIAGVILTVGGTALSPVILGWMGTPKDILPKSISYFSVYFAGVIFLVMYNVFVGILHAVGDSRHPLYYLIISSLTNVVLDLVFVAAFRWGVWAAALATTIAQGISAVLCFLRLIRVTEPYRIQVRQVRIHWDCLKQVVRYGLPSGIQNSVISMANVVVQTNINSFGKAAVAGCGAYSKLEGFAFLPVGCFTQALATFVGQNLGAKQYDRTKKGVAFGILCAVSMAVVVGIGCYLFAPQMIAFFNSDPEVVDYGTRHMRTICLFFGLLALSHCIASVLRGAGRAVVPMAVMLLCWCVLRVAYVSVAVQIVNELETVSRAYPITWTASSIIYLIYFFTADWLHGFDKEGKVAVAKQRSHV